MPVLLWVPAHAGRQPLRRQKSLNQNEMTGNSVSRYESNVLVSGLADINECERPSNCLRGRCINSMGSYHCECQKGYVLVGGRRCQGQPSLAVLITIATKSQERLNLHLESLKLIFKCSPHSKMMIHSGHSCNNVVDGSLEAFSHLSSETAGVWIKSDTDGGVCLSAFQTWMNAPQTGTSASPTAPARTDRARTRASATTVTSSRRTSAAARVSPRHTQRPFGRDPVVD